MKRIIFSLIGLSTLLTASWVTLDDQYQNGDYSIIRTISTSDSTISYEISIPGFWSTSVGNSTDTFDVINLDADSCILTRTGSLGKPEILTFNISILARDSSTIIKVDSLSDTTLYDYVLVPLGWQNDSSFYDSIFYSGQDSVYPDSLTLSEYGYVKESLFIKYYKINPFQFSLYDSSLIIAKKIWFTIERDSTIISLDTINLEDSISFNKSIKNRSEWSIEFSSVWYGPESLLVLAHVGLDSSEAFREYLDWKHKCGWDITVLSTVYSTDTSDTNAEKIIKNTMEPLLFPGGVYRQNRIRTMVIFGDYNYVPFFHDYWGDSRFRDGLYCILFGVPRLFWPGRILYNSENLLNEQIDKIFRYERYQQDTKPRKIVLFYANDYESNCENSIGGFFRNSLIVNTLLDRYSSNGILDTNIIDVSNDELCSKDYDSLSNAWNHPGTSVILGQGHSVASVYSWQLPWSDTTNSCPELSCLRQLTPFLVGELFDSSSIPIVDLSTCGVNDIAEGSFTGENCIGEALIYKNNGGAVAVYAGNRTSGGGITPAELVLDQPFGYMYSGLQSVFFLRCGFY